MYNVIPPEKKQRALELLADGRMKMITVAMRCGIAYQTLQWWTYQPEFKRELDAERKRIISHRGAYINKEQRLIGLSAMAEQARQQWEEHPMLVETRTMGSVSTTIERPNDASFMMFVKAVAEIGKLMGDYKPQIQVSQDVKLTGLTINVPQMTSETMSRYVQSAPVSRQLASGDEEDDDPGGPEDDGDDAIESD